MPESIKKHKKIALILGDLILFYLALFCVLFVRLPNNFSQGLNNHLLPFSIIFPVWLVIYYITGLNDDSTIKNNYKLIKNLFQATIINIVIAVSFFYIIPTQVSPKRNLIFVAVFVFTLTYLWRHIFSLIIKSNRLQTKIAFIGFNKEVLETIKEIENNPSLGYKIIFLLAPDKKHSLIKKIPKTFNTYFGLSKLNRLLSDTRLSKVIVATKPETSPVLTKELYHSSSNIEFVYFPDFYEEIFKKVPVEMINRFWLQKKSNLKRYLFFKRIFDITLASIAGVLLLVLLPFIVIAYLLTDGFPIFFVQSRIGKNGERFNIYKLRTMIRSAERDRPLWAEKNDVRVTKIGKYLRKFYIDELPQFLNILKGEMSVVGPRPERPEFVKTLEKEISFYPMRHTTNPGITGWAQIRSFYARSIDDSIEKTRYDLYYIKNQSLFFDIDIVLKTFQMFFSKRKKQNY